MYVAPKIKWSSLASIVHERICRALVGSHGYGKGPVPPFESSPVFIDRPKITRAFAAAANDSRLRQCVSLRHCVVSVGGGQAVPPNAYVK